ncbi:MAG: hypothetical protein AAGA97_02950 [Pseudomonadota bacterium]
MYWTYGSVDPTTRLFVYVGQTGSLERRKKQHLMAHRLKKPKKGSIQHWLSKTIWAGDTPLFVILDDKTVTEEESLASELEWVERLAAVGHPLFNR